MPVIAFVRVLSLLCVIGVQGFGHALSPGTIDPAFVRGVDANVIPQNSGSPMAMALQSDGKIVTLASCWVGTKSCIERYDAGGLPDSTFGTGGQTKLDSASLSTQNIVQFSSVGVQSSGKLVLSGTCVHIASTGQQIQELCLARLTATGTVDTTFGIAGLVTVSANATTSSNAFATVLSIGSNDTITVGGACGALPCVLRFSSEGALNPTFANAGIAVYSAAGNMDPYFCSNRCVALMQLADGTIFLGWSCANPANGQTVFCIASFTTNGSPNASFSGTGLVRIAVGPQASVLTSIAAHLDGLIVAGYCDAAPEHHTCAVRVRLDGNLDTSFGSSGKLSVASSFVLDSSIPNSSHAPVALTSATGNILLVSACTIDLTGFYLPKGLCMDRFLPNGSSNSNIGQGGHTAIAMGGGSSFPVTAMAPGSDVLVTFGYCDSLDSGYPQAGACLAQFRSDGAIDSAFGGGRYTIAKLPSYTVLIGAGLPAGGGKTIVLANCYDEGAIAGRPCAVRFDANGQLDSSFGTIGRAFGTAATIKRYPVSGAAMQDGKIYAVGECVGVSRFCVFRFLEGGQIDGSFGVGGMVKLNIGTYQDRPFAVAIDRNDRLLVAGVCQNSAAAITYAWCVARLLPNGTFDTAFAGGGVKWLSVVIPASLGISADGSITVVGRCNGPSGWGICVTRFADNGADDITYGDSGISYFTLGYTPPPDPTSTVRIGGVPIASGEIGGGKIVIAASCNDPASIQTTRLCSAQLNNLGALDMSYGTQGKAVIPIALSTSGSASGDLPRAAKVMKDGKLLFLVGLNPAIVGGTRCLVRVDALGLVDASFGSAGAACDTSLGAPSFGALAVQFDGRIIAVSQIPGSTNFLVASRVQGDPSGTPQCALDIDGDGTISTATDGVLLIRYQLGFRDQALVQGVNFSRFATRIFATDIATFLERQTLGLTGQSISGLRDGLILFRLMQGLPNTSLLNGIFPPDVATAANAFDVRAVVNDRCATYF